MFIELNDAHLKIFSWEGTVLVRLRDGREVLLQGGEQLLLEFKPSAVADASAFGPPHPWVISWKRPSDSSVAVS